MASIQEGFMILLGVPEFGNSSRMSCCTANLSCPNPTTSNFDTSVVATSAAGARLIHSVDEFYAAAAAGVTRPNAQPIFKSYQQMMVWKQAQNRR